MYNITNTHDAVTLAKSYQPYGETLSSAGSGTSPFAFTGEQTDVSGLTYLRARYYSSGTGRFLTRDTWMGEYNRPLSLNRWGYVEGNPVNFTDPSGQLRWGCNTEKGRLNTAKQAVTISYTDPLNTYTAAGIAVQCYGGNETWPWNDIDYSGLGIAQITNKQAQTEYGVIIQVGDEHRGSGLRCYIPTGIVKDDGSCSICEFHDDMVDKFGQNYKDYFQLERWHDPNNEYWAQLYMRRRIKQVVDSCKNCTSTDEFIAAALGQNGSGFDWKSAEELSTVGPNLPWRKEKNGIIRWDAYFDERIAKKGYQGWFDTRHQLDLFANFVWKLKSEGWYVPTDLKWNDVIWPLVYDTYSP